MITKADLENRDGGPQVEGKRRREGQAEPSAAEDRLALLEQRIAQARQLKPKPGIESHCSDCFQRGRDAVLKLLGGE